MTARERADRLLVARGLFDSRARAQAAIAAGLVTADERPVRKPSDEIASDPRLAAAPAFPWVSRGGVKLAHAPLVALIAPQFEAPRRHRKRGVVPDAETHATVCADIAAFVASLGWHVIATLPSSIEGGEGARRG